MIDLWPDISFLVIHIEWIPSYIATYQQFLKCENKFFAFLIYHRINTERVSLGDLFALQVAFC